MNDMISALKLFAAKLSESPIYRGSEFGFTVGARYARVFRIAGSSRSAIAFVDMTTGDAYKSASWKARSKTFMGNVFAQDAS